MPIIADLKNVTYTHWNQSSPTLVDLSLQIQQGTLNVLVGPGGSGKSTLCNLFNGEVPHLMGGEFAGDVFIDGINTRQVEVKDLARQVGHVFQDPESMFATLTVEDEIAFGPENLRFAPADIREITTKLLADTDLSPFRERLVWALSGGQVQKLGLAAVLAMQPRLIILDEPTSNLDPAATRSVHELVLALREHGMTILLVTRELDDFLARADQLLVIEKGHLLAAGVPAQVLAEHGQELQRLGIWLPETTEIGLALKQLHPTLTNAMPITVEETLSLLQSSNTCRNGLIGRTPQPKPALGDCLISAQNLSFSYGGAPALLDVSLDIHAGEMLAIVGRNGAGKSTLARLLVGLLKPQGGKLDLFGKPAAKWKVQDLANRIALVFQNPEHQFLTDSVSDEIGYSLLARGITEPAERAKAIQDTLQLLGLTGYELVHPFALSAGMKRRLGVATMLVSQPQVLLVDEPTYGQDKQMTQTLMALMDDIRRQGIAVVMITHDMRLVQEYAERVVVMSAGRVCFDGDPAGLFDRDDILEAANLCPTLLHSLVGQLRAQGIPIQGEMRNTQDFLDALTNANPEAK
ncbi:MAG: ABC transporter ATP-binding protein [Chloroflexota bacterium]